VLLIFCISILLLVGSIPNVGSFQNRGQLQYSWSIAEAKKRGTLVSEVEILPKFLSFAGNKITFSEAWLERCPDGEYALCFRVERGKEIFEKEPSPFLVRGERNAGFIEHHGRGWLQFVERLESADLSSVRASLVQNWKEKRSKDIRFIQKRI
jgi:hypothetical protein